MTHLFSAKMLRKEAHEIVGYFMRHKTGFDVAFSWNKDDPDFSEEWERIPAMAQPAPASTGRGIAEEMCSTMMGVAELKLKMAKSKEQVEAALEISGARELDVEAERRAMFQAFSECLVHGNSMTPTEIADKLLAARSAAQGTQAEAGAEVGAKSAVARMDTAFDGGAGLAPVSTEQAGDAAPDGWIAVAAVQGELTSVAFRDEKTARAVCAEGEPFPFWRKELVISTPSPCADKAPK